MVFSYEQKVIIKYLRIKYKHGATRIVNDHLEYEWCDDTPCVEKD